MSEAVHVELCEGALPAGGADASGSVSPSSGGGGAVLCFEGVVRGEEDGRALLALDYEAYEPMTSRQLRGLAGEVLAAHGVLSVGVRHSVGRVAVGEVSFRLAVASKHRKEGIAAVDAFIDRMKREVALWKIPVFAPEVIPAPRPEASVVESKGQCDAR